MASLAEVFEVVKSNMKSDRRSSMEDWRAMYEGEQARFIEKRHLESDEAFRNRPKDFRNFTFKVIDLLSGLYDEEPARKFFAENQPEDGDEVEMAPWNDRLVQAYDFRLNQPLLRECDAMTRLMGISAIQPRWREEFDEIKFVLYTADEFDVWTKAGRPDEAEFVAVYWVQDDLKFARVWSDDETHLFRQRKPQADVRRGEQPTPVMLEEIEDPDNPDNVNPYGELPFAFFFNVIPHDDFFVPGIGIALIPANMRFNEALSDLAHALQYQSHGQWWASGVDPTWAPAVGPDVFIKLEENGQLGVLAPTLDVDGMLSYLNAVLDQTLETHGIPRAAFRLEKAETPSGIALVAEQLPLIEERQKRASLFRRWESNLAWKMGLVLSVHEQGFSLPERERDLGFLIDYADPEPPIPGPQQIQQWDWELSKGLRSPVDVYLKLNPGLTREEAKKDLKRINEENAEFRDMRMESMPDELLAGMGGRFGMPPRQPAEMNGEGQDGNPA